MRAEKSISKLYELFLLSGGRVTTDSRAVAGQAGVIFFALKGERFDGHRYAAQALSDGASLAVVEKLPDEVDETLRPRYFVVENTLQALQQLAAYHRKELGLPVVALTGTNGKTTTKELIVRVLSTRYRVAATCGNFNNHIGVPLTLLSFTAEDDIGVVEMGANHSGEIAELMQIASPDLGLITNIGRAHLEGFGGPEGVRKAKGEMYDWLAAHGKAAFYSQDDLTLSEMVAERPQLAGHSRGYTTAGLGIGLCPDTGPDNRLTLELGGGEHCRRVLTHLTGTYNLSNVAAALAVGDYFGIPVEEGVEAVAAYEPRNNRSQVVRSEKTGNTLYLDCYNANPSSMEAAIKNFLRSPEPGVLILGDMYELGAFSDAEHTAVLRLLGNPETRAEIFLVGPAFSKAFEGSDIRPGISAFGSVEELSEYLQKQPLRESRILIKGSRGMALERLTDLL